MTLGSFRASVEMSYALAAVLTFAILTTLYVAAVALTPSADSGTYASDGEKKDVLVLKEKRSGPVTIGTHVDTHPAQTDGSILDLEPSHDLRGGDQMSISFKLECGNESANQCLLLWGDKNTVKFKSADSDDSVEGLLVYMPLIWFTKATGSTEGTIHVFFNTTSVVRNTVKADIVIADGLVPPVITVTFADQYSEGHPTGCKCDVYSGTTFVGGVHVPGQSIMRNKGLMYVLPTDVAFPSYHPGASGGLDDVIPVAKISDLSYHNYEMGPGDVHRKSRGEMAYTTTDLIALANRKRGAYDPSMDSTYHFLFKDAIAARLSR